MIQTKAQRPNLSSSK